MGGKLSRFTPEEVSIYESCTCLDGAELTTVYEKFIKMGGRRVTKGAMLEESYRRAIGHKTVKNLTAGTAAVALSQVRGDSPAHHSHARAPAPCRRMPSPGGDHKQRTHITRSALTSHAARSHAAHSHHTQRAHTQRTTFPGGDEHGWRGRLKDQGGEGAQGAGL